MSEGMPEGWSQKELGEIIYRPLAYGVLKPGPYVSSGVPIVKIQDIRNGRLKVDGLHRISKELDDEFKRTKLNAGDLIISLVGTIGKTLTIPATLDGANISRAFGVIGIKSEYETNYVKQSLDSNESQKWIIEQSQGNAQKVLNLGALRQLQLSLPPKQEQQKIASILSSADEVVEKTESQISKLQDLKKGMMQELLTKGIGHTEFKDSPVGRIPKGWDVDALNELVVKVGSGITPKGGSKAYVDVGIPLIRSQNVYPDGLRLSDVSYISEEQHHKMSNSQLQPNDVLLNITGASIGRCYYLPDDFSVGNVNQHVCIIRLNKDQAHHVYLTLFLNSQFGQSQIMSLQAGGNREGLNFQQIRAIKLAVPPLREQVKIANAVSTVENNIKAQLSKLDAVKNIKKSLMQDLLTGKVRVKVN